MSDKMIPCLMPTYPSPTPHLRLVPAHSLDLINRQRMWSGVLFLVGCQLVLVTSTKTPLETREKERGDTERGGQRGREEDSHQQG